MGQPAAFIGSNDTGEGCFPPRTTSAGSSNVFINGKGAHRQGDAWPVHSCGDSHHSSVTTGGSGTVFVNGVPLARIGDSLDCGSAVAQGSSNVFSG